MEIYHYLRTIIRNQNEEIVELLLKYKANTEISMLKPKWRTSDCFALHVSIRNNNYNIIYQLLSRNANPNSLMIQDNSEYGAC